MVRNANQIKQISKFSKFPNTLKNKLITQWLSSSALKASEKSTNQVSDNLNLKDFENSQAKEITNDSFLDSLINSSQNLQLYNKKFADFIGN